MFLNSFCHANGDLTYAQLRISNMNRQLWMEHVLWTRFFILSTAFGLPDLPFVTQRLLQNPQDFADALRPLYGEQTAAQFANLLTEHIMIAGQLVNAAKVGNKAEVESQKKKWYANAEDIAHFLASINPFWKEKLWQDLLFDHLHMTKEEAVQILTGQYEAGVEQFGSIQAEALAMADLMTCGILKQSCI
ncbi:acetylglutamate kinase [Aminipila butyrica]|uniref:Acetylglutamate kinase n=2 Tax=Aminipila butyrica TaxID=433296 RepID=A0A858C0Z0_9FIRM|nr:acetylglutamate kinase [Aminipila butyrica]